LNENVDEKYSEYNLKVDFNYEAIGEWVLSKFGLSWDSTETWATSTLLYNNETITTMTEDEVVDRNIATDFKSLFDLIGKEGFDEVFGEDFDNNYSDELIQPDDLDSYWKRELKNSFEEAEANMNEQIDRELKDTKEKLTEDQDVVTYVEGEGFEKADKSHVGDSTCQIYMLVTRDEAQKTTTITDEEIKELDIDDEFLTTGKDEVFVQIIQD